MNRRSALAGALTGVAALLSGARPARADPPGSPAADQAAHCAWLEGIIREAESVKAGMTRRDVERAFREDVGGRVESRQSLRYQHRRCPYVKLTLTFRAATSASEKDDTVITCSEPFLDRIPNSARF